MNALELKGSILELLANIQDVAVLSKIKQLLSQAAKSKNDPDWLTDEQVLDLQKALEEIEHSPDWTSHDEHMQKFRTW